MPLSNNQNINSNQIPSKTTNQNTKTNSIQFPNNRSQTQSNINEKLAGLHMDIPAFSGMLLNDEISIAILNYKYNNQMLTDTNTLLVFDNSNMVLPAGDPGMKPLQILNWISDFKVSRVKLPYAKIAKAKLDFASAIKYSPTINFRCRENMNFDGIRRLGSQYDWIISKMYSKYMSDSNVSKYFAAYKDNPDLLKDNIYAILFRESGFNENAINRYNRNGYIDCGLGQINMHPNNLRSFINYLPAEYKHIAIELANKVNKQNQIQLCSDILKKPETNIAFVFAALAQKLHVNRGNIRAANLAYVGYIRRFSGNADCVFRALQKKYPNVKIY